MENRIHGTFEAFEVTNRGTYLVQVEGTVYTLPNLSPQTISLANMRWGEKIELVVNEKKEVVQAVLRA